MKFVQFRDYCQLSFVEFCGICYTVSSEKRKKGVFYESISGKTLAEIL